MGMNLKLVVGCMVFNSSIAMGVSLQTSDGDYVLDWSSSRLKFKATAKVENADQDSFTDVEKRAWAKGIADVRKIGKSVYQSHYKTEGQEIQKDVASSVDEAGLRAARGVFSKNTEYVSDGSVTVSLEARLSSILKPFNVSHTVVEKPSVEHLEDLSGLVFKISCAIEPRADLKIENEAGDTLYAPNLISEKAYLEVLSGRWYRSPKPWELRRAAGKKPKELLVACEENGRLVVKSEDWEAIDSGVRDTIVKAARVAIVVP